MSEQDDLDLDIDSYAELSAALAGPEADRAAILAAHDLDEEGWDALEERWLARLAAAEEAFGDADGVPPLVAAYAQAFARAQSQQADEVMPFERYVEMARALKKGRDVPLVLKRYATSLPTFLRSHQHWTARAATDPELGAKLSQLLR